MVDLDSTVDYALSVNSTGELLVAATSSTTNNSKSLKQINTTCGSINFKNCNDLYGVLVGNLTTQINNYENAVLTALQVALAWYFPGSSSFSFSQIGFSANGDLTTNIVYSACAPGGAANPSVSTTSIA